MAFAINQIKLKPSVMRNVFCYVSSLTHDAVHLIEAGNEQPPPAIATEEEVESSDNNKVEKIQNKLKNYEIAYNEADYRDLSRKKQLQPSLQPKFYQSTADFSATTAETMQVKRRD